MAAFINIQEKFNEEIRVLTEQLALMVEISENWEDSAANLSKVQECISMQDNVKQLSMLIKINTFHQAKQMIDG